MPTSKKSSPSASRNSPRSLRLRPELAKLWQALRLPLGIAQHHEAILELLAFTSSQRTRWILYPPRIVETCAWVTSSSAVNKKTLGVRRLNNSSATSPQRSLSVLLTKITAAIVLFATWKAALGSMKSVWSAASCFSYSTARSRARPAVSPHEGPSATVSAL